MVDISHQITVPTQQLADYQILDFFPSLQSTPTQQPNLTPPHMPSWIAGRFQAQKFRAMPSRILRPPAMNNWCLKHTWFSLRPLLSVKHVRLEVLV